MPETVSKGPELLGQTETIATSVARALEDAGVRVVFGLDDPQALWHALRKCDRVETVVVHDERSAAFMADGYARASGIVGVCGAISGPGGTNLATGLLEAQKAHTPVLAVIGESAVALPGRHSFQTAPHEAVLRPLVKNVVRITRAEEAYAATRNALDLCRAGRPGPVLLLAGDDFLWNAHTDGGTPSEPPMPLARSAADPDAVRLAALTLGAAERPVIFVGGGGHTSGAGEELGVLAEILDAPVVTSMMAKGIVADDHRLCMGVASAYTGSPRGRGHVADQLLVEADVILVVGSDLDSVTTSGDAWPRSESSVIRVEVDPEELLGRGGIHLLGDARQVLGQLVGEVAPVPERAWTTDAVDRHARQLAAVRELDASRADDGYVWPGAVIGAISDALRASDTVVTDASYSSAWVMDRLRQTFPGRVVLAPRGSGVLGWGLPGAVGARYARGDGRLTLVTGDGGLLFTVGELESVTRLGLQLTVVLLNNHSFGYQRQADMLWQGKPDLPDLRFGQKTDFAAVARGFGFQSTSVRTAEEFAEVYGRAGDGPWFIDVLVHEDVRPPITRMDLD